MNLSKAKFFVELTKPRILFMILLTAYLGYFLGSQGNGSNLTLLWLLLGTAGTSGGAAALNNFLERDIDFKMKRTRKRALPCGAVSAPEVLAFGILLVLSGTILLVWQVNLLTGFLALLTAFLYVLVYTPLKRITWMNTMIGAIPGALPPLGGWAAATNSVTIGGWVLFAILFIWQHPHFYAIAWMYKEDYARGGLKMLPVVDPDGRSTFRQIIIFSILLILVTLLPFFLGLSGRTYALASIICGMVLLIYGMMLYLTHSTQDARRLLKASVIYLPVILGLIAMDAKFH